MNIKKTRKVFVAALAAAMPYVAVVAEEADSKCFAEAE